MFEFIKFNRVYSDYTGKYILPVKNKNKRDAIRLAKRLYKAEFKKTLHNIDIANIFFDSPMDGVTLAHVVIW